MVKHIILWKLKDSLTGEEKEQVKAGIREGPRKMRSGDSGRLQNHIGKKAQRDNICRNWIC